MMENEVSFSILCHLISVALSTVYYTRNDSPAVFTVRTFQSAAPKQHGFDLLDETDQEISSGHLIVVFEELDQKRVLLC